MLSKTSRKDVAKDKASDLASAVADAAEAGREKIAPVARNVTDHLADAADKAAEAAAPHVAKAREATAEAVDATAPHVEKAKEAAKDASADAADAAAPRVKKAKKAAKKASKDAADAAAPRVTKVEKASKKARKDARKASKKARRDAAPYVETVKAAAADRAETAGLTKDQAHRLFADEWMPRIQETITATAAAGGSAYAALPQQARDAADTLAPRIAKKRRKKGKVLITLGLLAGAGAVALYFSGQQKHGSKTTTPATPPEVERLEVSAAEDLEDSQGRKDSVKVSESDDAVGDLEKDVNGSVSGSRRGRHAANE